MMIWEVFSQEVVVSLSGLDMEGLCFIFIAEELNEGYAVLRGHERSKKQEQEPMFVRF